MDVDTTAPLEESPEEGDADRYAVYFTKEELLELSEFFGESGEMEDYTHDRVARKIWINCAKYGFYDGEL